MQALATTKLNPTGGLPQPLPKGQFLVDREGIVRWTNVECAAERLSGLGKFPTAEGMLAITRAVV